MCVCECGTQLSSHDEISIARSIEHLVRASSLTHRPSFIQLQYCNRSDLVWIESLLGENKNENKNELEQNEWKKRTEQELRVAFDKDKEKHPSSSKLLLSVAVPAGQDNIDNGFDVPTISR